MFWLLGEWCRIYVKKLFWITMPRSTIFLRSRSCFVLKVSNNPSVNRGEKPLQFVHRAWKEVLPRRAVSICNSPRFGPLPLVAYLGRDIVSPGHFGCLTLHSNQHGCCFRGVPVEIPNQCQTTLWIGWLIEILRFLIWHSTFQWIHKFSQPANSVLPFGTFSVEETTTDMELLITWDSSNSLVQKVESLIQLLWSIQIAQTCRRSCLSMNFPHSNTFQGGTFWEFHWKVEFLWVSSFWDP